MQGWEPIRLLSNGRPEGDSGILERLAATRKAIAREYRKRHSTPWIVAYSGGKDSTLLLQLVWEAMATTPPDQKKRPIYVIGNDTLVESPLIIDHLRNSIAAIDKAAKKENLPVQTLVTKPCADDTFWVNLIGRGYIPPTRNFRWCTDRMKIEPTNRALTRIVRQSKRAILLVGTRKSESQNRQRRMKKHGVTTHKMNSHTNIQGCKVFSPLAELTDNDVWTILLQSRPPWGGTHRKLITLYRNAGGGECPLVLSKEDAPSCGTTSPRFGCWTCSVVQKDRSMRGVIDSGHEDMENLEELAEFRDWLMRLREDESKRMNVRRDGRIRIRANGTRVMGPFKIDVRKKILSKLEELQERVKWTLITESERELIDEIWRVDQIHHDARLAVQQAFGAI